MRKVSKYTKSTWINYVNSLSECALFLQHHYGVLLITQCDYMIKCCLINYKSMGRYLLANENKISEHNIYLKFVGAAVDDDTKVFWLMCCPTEEGTSD